MQEAVIVALVVAIGSGIAIGVQSTLNNWSGRLVGPLGTGLVVNTFSGVIAGLLLVLFAGRLAALSWDSFKGAAFVMVAAGALGIAIVSGIAFSLPRIGIAAGLSAIILGQMLVAVVVDSRGWGGLEPIPLSMARVLGLVLLLVATWLLVPSTN